ncbi:hypothetical protein FQN54_000621 [Arachnomyces sp. PD_36]|nr:hypothetical protein FQN54_000621 [Arachnomyces sp. PD_36]
MPPPSPTLQSHYPWLSTTQPPLASAPMLNISLPSLATSVSLAGGFGFLAGGFDLTNLSTNLSECARLLHLHTSTNNTPPLKTAHEGDTENQVLPIGLGLITWGCSLPLLLSAISQNTPSAIWLFAPSSHMQLRNFAESIRETTGGKTRIWVQITSVREALEATDPELGVCADVLVVQGGDAGGHGRRGGGAGVISLVPEVRDALGDAGRGESVPLFAAGGVVDGRGVAASLALGADGAVLGTRFLASKEASITEGYRDEILRASDGGVSTVRTKVYDRVRGIYGWPEGYDGRGVVNRTFVEEVVEGVVGEEENRRLYEEEVERVRRGDEGGRVGWGPEGRMTTYAGTGVGLVREVKSAREIVEGVGRGANEVLGRLGG